MKTMRRIARGMSSLLILTFVCLGVQAPAQAGMVGTDTIFGQVQASEERARVLAALERKDVRKGLVSLGVDPQSAQDRVLALSDDEVSQMAGRLDQLPAGGDALGVAVFIFVLLLVTDILGFTNVFPFVKKTIN
ncbi:MAG: PA2779 family protein [Gammaproteobacteria bacterium]|nr:PA2779 family protein [Gammaproteobacteria bacterium]